MFKPTIKILKAVSCSLTCYPYLKLLALSTISLKTKFSSSWTLLTLFWNSSRTSLLVKFVLKGMYWRRSSTLNSDSSDVTIADKDSASDVANEKQLKMRITAAWNWINIYFQLIERGGGKKKCNVMCRLWHCIKNHYYYYSLSD